MIGSMPFRHVFQENIAEQKKVHTETITFGRGCVHRMIKFITSLWVAINSKLLYKMIIIYSLLTVIPLVLVSTTFYLRSKNAIETKLIESRNQALVETSDKIDGVLNVYVQKINDIGESSNIQTLLRNDMNPTKYPLQKVDINFAESTLYAIINNEKNSNKTAGNDIESIYIMNAAGKIYATEGAAEMQFPLAIRLMPFQFIDLPEWAFFIDHQRMLCVKRIMDSVTRELLGYAVITLKTDQVAKLYISYPPNTFFITNRSGIIVSSDHSEQIGNFLDTNKKEDILANKRVSIHRNLVYQNLVSQSTLYKEINDLGYFAGVITLITFVVVLLLTITILRRITHPLRQLTILMRKAEREIFEPITSIKTYDEIAQLGISYNSLISEIKDLIGQVYKAELFKKEAEIKAIKMQMNPHFLYNTLETIGILAKSKDNIVVVPDMVKKLSRILRFSITSGNDYIPLKTEVQLAKWYIQIHQYRYGEERLSCHIAIADELLSVKVPKLIIQPIIENAILHGIDQTQRSGVILIRAFELDYHLVLEVEDNGPGFWTKEQDPKRKSQGLGTGLDQVEARIQLLYGNQYGISIAKSDEEGSIIRLTLPMMMNEEGA